MNHVQHTAVRRSRMLRFGVLALLVVLVTMATGCDEILVDVLYGDGCGDHAVCERKAAAAGAAAGGIAVAGAVLQRKEDGEGGLETDGDGRDDGGGGYKPEWSLNRKPSEDHVWDEKEKKWVLPADEDKTHEMKDKGYEFDEDYGDGGAWRKPPEKTEEIDIPREKGDVTLPEYKAGLVSPTAEARYDRLEERLNQLNELEQKAIDDYKRLRTELRDAEAAGDDWLAGKLRSSLETARDNVDKIQAEKASLAARHEQHSDQKFQERYTKGWTAGQVAREILLDPFVHMIAPDMSDTVDVMANAIAARNRLQTQIDRQDSVLFREHDQAMSELREVIKQRHEALQTGDSETADRLKQKADGIKDRLNDVTKRMESFHEDSADYQKKALKATLETGTTAADRVVSGRGAYETGKYVAKKAGFQSEKPQVSARKPKAEDLAESSKGESKKVTESKQPSGTGDDGGGKPPKKSLKQMVRENPNPAQQAGKRAAAKAEWEQQYQADAEKVYGKGNVPETRGRTLPRSQAEWTARSKQLGVSRDVSLKGWNELSGMEPSTGVKSMYDSNPSFRDLDMKVRECWRNAEPGVGPGFRPDYYNRFVQNMRNAGISDAYFKQWMNAIKSGKYVPPDLRTLPPR